MNKNAQQILHMLAVNFSAYPDDQIPDMASIKLTFDSSHKGVNWGAIKRCIADIGEPKRLCPDCGEDIQGHYDLGANGCPCLIHKSRDAQ